MIKNIACLTKERKLFFFHVVFNRIFLLVLAYYPGFVLIIHVSFFPCKRKTCCKISLTRDRIYKFKTILIEEIKYKTTA